MAELTTVAEEPAARERAAAALRRLGHALVGHDCDEAMLERITRDASATAEAIEQHPARSRPIETMKRRLWESPPPDGEAMSHFPDCVVSGAANPMGIAIAVRREGQEAVADLNLGAAFEGAPRRAHGGVVAAIFDDVMGYVLVLHRTPAFTGSLRVHYRAPVPVGEDVTVRGWLVHRSGRKLQMRAEMAPTARPDEPICDAEALFVAIPPERLGLSPDELDSLAARLEG